MDHPLVFQSFRRFSPESIQRSAQFHRLIRDAIANQEGPRAGRLMQEHVYQGRDVLLGGLKDVVLDDGADTGPG